MSRRAPLAFEEKKTRLLQLLHETRGFYQLKELERLAPKEKGIVASSVKDVLQAAVDDGAVDSDRIGGSVYFWAFPSKALAAKKRRLEELRGGAEAAGKRLRAEAGRLAQVEAGREGQERVAEILEEVEGLKGERDRLAGVLAACGNHDLEKIVEMKAGLPIMKDAANRWTDNIFWIQNWCKKKFMMEVKELNKQFGIDDEMDFLP